MQSPQRLSVCLAVRLRCGSSRKRVTYHYPRVRATVKVSNPLGDCRRHHAVECLRSSLAPKSRSDCVQRLGSRYTFRSHSSYYLVFVRLLKHYNVTHTLLWVTPVHWSWDNKVYDGFKRGICTRIACEDWLSLEFFIMSLKTKVTFVLVFQENTYF